MSCEQACLKLVREAAEESQRALGQVLQRQGRQKAERQGQKASCLSACKSVHV